MLRDARLCLVYTSSLVHKTPKPYVSFDGPCLCVKPNHLCIIGWPLIVCKKTHLCIIGWPLIVCKTNPFMYHWMAPDCV